MNRRKWLVVLILVLLAGNVVWRIYRGWGLVTIHADKRPIAEIVREIEGQGHVRVISDLDSSTVVSMNVDRVPVTEALEVLAVNTDARWRLLYSITQSSREQEDARGVLLSGSAAPGWRLINFPMPTVQDDDDFYPADPRYDNLKLTTPGPFQAVLEQSARLADVSFLVPDSLNPVLSKVPREGDVRKVVPKMASIANANCREWFRLSKSRWRERGPDTADNPQRQRGAGGPPGGEGGRRRFDPEAMVQRMQERINQLPAEQRATAQEFFNKEKAFWESIRDLPPEERREKMRERFEDPAVQQRMEDRMSARESRMSPEQRTQRFKQYVNRRDAAQNASGR